MSIPLMPSAQPGLTWDVTKTPMSSTRVLTARSGLEWRAANWSFGKYKFQLTYSMLRQNRNGTTELQQVFGFCLKMQGMFLPFAYNDPTDNSVAAQTIGNGDGTTTQFALVRAFGGWVDPVLCANTVTAVYINGSATSAYTLIQRGQYGIDTIQMNSPPSPGQVITADFSYYFPCRFLQDDPEFNNFAFQFWELKKLQFQSVK